METIKDLVDLATQLANSVEDRRVASELLSIQKLILQVQSEQTAIHDSNVALREEKFKLQQEIIELRKDLKECSQDLDSDTKMKWEKPFYWKIERDHNDVPYCQKCFDADKKLIRVQEQKNDRWLCHQCKSVFNGPNYKPPQRRNISSYKSWS